MVERPKRALAQRVASPSALGVLRNRDGLDNMQGSDETLEQLEKSGKLSSHHAKVRAKMGKAKPSEHPL